MKRVVFGAVVLAVAGALLVDGEAVLRALGIAGGTGAAEAPDAVEATAAGDGHDAGVLARGGARLVPRADGADRPAASGADATAAAAGVARTANVGLDGVVLRADGRPAVGARVTLIAADGTSALAEVDADGKFRVGAPPGRYDLLVRAGRAGALSLRDVYVDGRPLDGVLELGPAVTLRVEATLDAGPLFDAATRLRWSPEGAAPRAVAEARTDRDGVAETDGLPPGRYTVEVDAAPGTTAIRTLDVSADTTVAVKVPALGRWTGRVTDASSGTPLAAEVVVTVPLDGGLARASALADTGGVFAVVTPRGKVRQVLVQHPGYVPFPATPAEARPTLDALSLLPREDVHADVALRAGALASGTVLDAGTKTPVAGLTLDFTSDAVRMPPEMGLAPRSATSRDDGSYEVLGLAPGTWTVSVSTPGWYADGRPSVRVPAPDASGRATPARLDVGVRGSGTVSGRVARPDGTPVVRARVWLVGGRGGTVRAARQAGRLLETVSGTDGTFALDDVPPAEWIRVRAAAGDDEATPSSAFRLLDATPPPFVLVLAATGTITGHVVDLVTRAPLADVRVRIDASGDPGGRGRRSVTTAADGRFEAKGLIPGPWRLRADPRRDYLPCDAVDVTLSASAPPLDVAVTLDPGLAVAGTVLDPAGTVVVGARITLAGREDVGTPPPAVTREARTAADGTFRIGGLRSGTFAIDVRFGGAVRAHLDGVRGGERALVFRIEP